MPCYCETTSYNSSSQSPVSGHSSSVGVSSSYVDAAPVHQVEPARVEHRSFLSRLETESAAERGTRIHSTISSAERTAHADGTAPIGGGLEILTNSSGLPIIERTAGGIGRVDVAYVNHTSKQILVHDYFTGPKEPIAHARKGYKYAEEPDIKKWIDRGYTFHYECVYTNTVH